MKEITELRVELDMVAQLVKEMNGSKEVTIALFNIEEAKMCLGKVAHYLGNADPYPDSRNYLNDRIKKTTDTYERTEGRLTHYDTFSEIQKVKYIRNINEGLLLKIDTLSDKGQITVRPKALAFAKEAYMCLTKGDMWLGMELGRIFEDKEEAKKQEEALVKSSEPVKEPVKDMIGNETKDLIDQPNGENAPKEEENVTTEVSDITKE